MPLLAFLLPVLASPSPVVQGRALGQIGAEASLLTCIKAAEISAL
jgi:hypothetical protein